MMKLGAVIPYLKKSKKKEKKKEKNHVTHPLTSAAVSIFFIRN